MATTTLDAVRLYRMDLPDHPCPWGLRALRLLQERHIPFEDHRLTSSEAVDAFKAAHGVATTPQIFAGAERIGGSTELAAQLGVRPETAEISSTPVVAVFATAGLMALVLSVGISGFTGLAICLLAMLKLSGEFRRKPDHGRHGRRDARQPLSGGQALARPLVSSRAIPEAITTRVRAPRSNE